MKIYWTLKQIPELRDLPMYQRIWVWWACRLKDWKFDLIVGLVYFAIVFTGLQLIVGFNALAIIGAIFSFIVWQFEIERLRPSFRDFLNEHGHT